MKPLSNCPICQSKLVIVDSCMYHIETCISQQCSADYRQEIKTVFREEENKAVEVVKQISFETENFDITAHFDSYVQNIVYVFSLIKIRKEVFWPPILTLPIDKINFSNLNLNALDQKIKTLILFS